MHMERFKTMVEAAVFVRVKNLTNAEILHFCMEYYVVWKDTE